MPRNAIRGAGADHIVKLEDLPELLVRLTNEPADPRSIGVIPGNVGAGYTPFVCPDCGGVLNLDEEELPSFRCQVGHRWNGRGLAAKQAEQLDLALWATLRTLKENVRLSRTLEQRALARGHPNTARRFGNRARESELRLRLVQEVLGLSGPRRGTRKRSREADIVERGLEANDVGPRPTNGGGEPPKG
jgi:two-component system chemotaxis response regulator CheB